MAKLVDILARELKVWPEGVVTAVQDLDGEVKFDNSHEMPRINKSKDVWIRQGDQGDCLQLPELAEDCSYAIVTLPLYQAAVDALKAESRPTESMALHHQEVGRITRQWSGEGLPPAGTVCEWKEKTGFQWVAATVLFITESSVVMQRSDGFEWQMLTKRTVFRPVRAPEQIAAEAYQHNLGELADHICGYFGFDDPRPSDVGVAEYLLDHGYRKPEIVDE